ncbi:hypothetical protein [Streptomyces sp. NBC_01320]|nr:hypothetical protein OG395_07930 [Streptomyces sp. NBC_01320]
MLGYVQREDGWDDNASAGLTMKGLGAAVRWCERTAAPVGA